MTKIEMFRSVLDFIPEDHADLREGIEAEIARLSKPRKKTVKPETAACMVAVRNAMDQMGAASKLELREITGESHQRVAAACNMLEKEGYLTVHAKGETEGKDFVWYSRN